MQGCRVALLGGGSWVAAKITTDGRPNRHSNNRQWWGRTGHCTQKPFEIQSDSERSQYTVKQRRPSGGCGLVEHGVRVALSHSPGGCSNDQQQRWRGEGRGVMIVKPIPLLHSIAEYGELEADARWWSAVSGCGPVTTTLHFTVDN